MLRACLTLSLFLFVSSWRTSSCSAELSLSAIFGDSMVLQRDKPIHFWGTTTPGFEVTVTIGDQSAKAKSDKSGRFDVELAPMPAGGPHEVTIAADETRILKDVLIGEVWLCSGQSNMQWAVASANDADLETLTANFPQLRLITVPNVGTQDPQSSFNGQWEACTPQSAAQFSAVGYFFGRQLHQTLNVPVGLIDNAWGGSSCEAWVKRDVLEADGSYGPLLKHWDDLAETFDHEAQLAAWKEKMAAWQADKKGQPPRQPQNVLAGQHRPANLYNGCLKPVIGYTMRGAIWYQGESNAGRAEQYGELFPLMIQSWRDEWKQGDLSFYWVQLADYMQENPVPSDSAWAELREAQTKTMSKLANTGEAVILNLGEASDIHPKNKQDVGKRLARWALAKDYGYEIPYHSPTFASMDVKDGRAILTFENVGGGLDTFDVQSPLGFTIAGEDKKFVKAVANVVDKSHVEVWSDEVKSPVAIRYAWADNPVCNLQSSDGLPVTPFRTDDWAGVTAGKVAP